MKNINKHIDKVMNNPYMQAIKHPEIYMKKMLVGTLWMGVAAFIVNWLYINTSLSTIKIPAGMHSMFGFVIAMLLVFRTNTAYDRWWEGRKKLQELKTVYSSMVAVAISSEGGVILVDKFKKNLDSIKTLLKSNESEKYHNAQVQFLSKMLEQMKDMVKSRSLSNEEYIELRKYMHEVLNIIVACERIKSTPIPLAYTIHIKVCIFIYTVTLPFSMLHDLSMWSTPIVMVLYFIISGTEIISSEIENPFQGEGNDLPVDELIDEIIDTTTNKKEE